MADEKYIIKIDQLPEFTIAARTPEDASRATARLIVETESLHGLSDEEPVQIKKADRTAWGRNLTLGAYRNNLVEHETRESEGPHLKASIKGE